MNKILSLTILYIVPAILIGYGIWQNIFALIVGLAWILSSFVLFELIKEDYER